MKDTAHKTPVNDVPSNAGRSTWWGWLLWLPMCIGFSVLLSWAAFKITPFFSPWLIFPLIIGVMLGASIVALTRLFQLGHRPTIWAAVLLSVGVLVVGQHFFSFRAALNDDTADFEKLQMARAMFGDLVQGDLPSRPDSFLGYLKYQAKEGRQFKTIVGDFTTKGAMAWLFWVIDGLLILIPTAVMVAFALRKPYCPLCGSWFSTRRCGRIEGKTMERLADELELTLEESPSGGHYWIDSCNQGCASSVFSLFFKKPSSIKSPLVVWLDNEQRNQVTKILDESQKQTIH